MARPPCALRRFSGSSSVTIGPSSGTTGSIEGAFDTLAMGGGSGDGAGMLTGLPHEFLARVAREDLGTELPEPGKFGAACPSLRGIGDRGKHRFVPLENQC